MLASESARADYRKTTDSRNSKKDVEKDKKDKQRKEKDREKEKGKVKAKPKGDAQDGNLQAKDKARKEEDSDDDIEKEKEKDKLAFLAAIKGLREKDKKAAWLRTTHDVHAPTCSHAVPVQG